MLYVIITSGLQGIDLGGAYTENNTLHIKERKAVTTWREKSHGGILYSVQVK